MKVLILDGTQFLGRHFVEIALKQGYEITLFNRGQTNNKLYPNVEKLRGDRLKGSLGAFFISTISVYAEFQTNGDETSPLYPINQDLPQVYGTLKAMAESVVDEIYGESGLIIRPGLIVGPYDNTGRFTYWIRRY